MNKYEIMLDMIEHPEKYSDEAIAEILSDKETAEIYESIALAAASVKSNADHPDVGEEWIRFKKQNNITRTRHIWKPGTRAASLGLLIMSSLAALAIGIGVSIGFISNKSPEMSEVSKVQQESSTATINPAASSTILNDPTKVNTDQIIYEDAPLSEILDEIFRIYKSPVKYESEGASALRLYFRLDPAVSLQENVDRLNVFDSFDISLEGDTIKVK